jgi:hypothetical protein
VVVPDTLSPVESVTWGRLQAVFAARTAEGRR